MYNIKQAADRAGVSVLVLRAWERRYGIVRPPRTASGYRRFDDAAVARIRTMRELVEQGWSPSAAAAAILAGEVAVRTDAARGDPGPGPGGPAGDSGGSRRSPDGAPGTADGDEAGAGTADSTGERLVVAARDLDEAAVERVLDDALARGTFERVATDILFPALRDLGAAWAAGEVSVAGEHLASGAVLRRLGQALEAAGRPARGRPAILVGLPPGARHELGALAFAVAARRAGLPVAYLGPDLPAADWVSAAAGARAAVIGVVTGRERRAALDVARELRSAHPGLLVAFGGEAAPDSPGVLRLPAALGAAVSALDAALSDRS